MWQQHTGKHSSCFLLNPVYTSDPKEKPGSEIWIFLHASSPHIFLKPAAGELHIKAF